MQFKVGDKAVYPAHGVGRVEAVENKEIAGTKTPCYVLKVFETGMTIFIPVDKIQSVGLRPIIPKKNVKKVYEILKERDIQVDQQTWNRRYREYMEKIRTGSVYEIAEVLRDLNLLKNHKTLSFGEKKMLDTARNLLTKELAIAENKSEEGVASELQKIFA